MRAPARGTTRASHTWRGLNLRRARRGVDSIRADVRRPSGFWPGRCPYNSRPCQRAAADRRFGMTKRIEQSRRRGHYDPRWTDRLHHVTENQPAVPNEPEVLTDMPVPRLTPVGGSAMKEHAAMAATP